MLKIIIFISMFLPNLAFAQGWVKTIDADHNDIDLINVLEHNNYYYVVGAAGHPEWLHFDTSNVVIYKFDTLGVQIDSLFLNIDSSLINFTNAAIIKNDELIFTSKSGDVLYDSLKTYINVVDLNSFSLTKSIIVNNSSEHWCDDILSYNDKFVLGGELNDSLSLTILDSTFSILKNKVFNTQGNSYSSVLKTIRVNQKFISNYRHRPSLLKLDDSLNVTHERVLDDFRDSCHLYVAGSSRYDLNYAYIAQLSDSVILSVNDISGLEHFGQSFSTRRNVVVSWIGIDSFNVINDVCLGKPDTSDFLAFKGMDTNEEFIYVVYTTDVLLNFIFFDSPGGRQYTKIAIAKIDFNGNIIWEREYGGDMFYRANAIKATSDGGALIVGQKYDWVNEDNGARDAIVIKIDKDGYIDSIPNNIESEITTEKLNAFPNPTSDYINILISGKGQNNLMLYDILGNIQNVKVEKIKKRVIIDVSHLKNGIYYLRNTNTVTKIVKL